MLPKGCIMLPETHRPEGSIMWHVGEIWSRHVPKNFSQFCLDCPYKCPLAKWRIKTGQHSCTYRFFILLSLRLNSYTNFTTSMPSLCISPSVEPEINSLLANAILVCPIVLPIYLDLSHIFSRNLSREKKCPLWPVPYKPYCVYLFCQLNSSLLYEVTRQVLHYTFRWHWYTIVPLPALFCLGRCKCGRIGMACRQHGGIPKTKST